MEIKIDLSLVFDLRQAVLYLWFWMLLSFLFPVVASGLDPVEAARQLESTRTTHRLKAWDCDQPLNIQDSTFADGLNPCHKRKTGLIKPVKQNRTFQLLHSEEKRRFTGHKCVLTKAQRAYYCGMHHHVTMDETLTYTEAPLRMSVADCRRAILDGKWSPAGNTPGREFSVQVPGHNRFKVEVAGKSYRHNGGLYCEGGTFAIRDDDRRPGQVSHYHNMVVIQEYRLIIEEEDFLADPDENLIVAKNSGTILKCKLREAGCATDMTTYYWTESGNWCDLAYVKQIRASTWKQNVDDDPEMEEILMSQDESLVRLVLKDRVPKCGRMVYSTNMGGIYLLDLTNGADGNQFKREIHAGEVRISDYVRNRDALLYNKLIDLLEEEYHYVNKKICEASFQNGKTQFWLKHSSPGIVNYMHDNGTFSTTAGEVVYTYQCRPVEVYARNMPDCYQALPVIHEGQARFIEPLTHLITEFGIKQPCSSKFNPKYQLANGDWVQATPGIAPAKDPVPDFIPNRYGNETWEALNEARKVDFIKGGLYNPEILKSMRAYRESSRSKEALSYALSHQYRPQPQFHSPQNFYGAIEPYELFDSVVPNVSWITRLFGGIWDGIYWYADAWSIVMSLIMGFQFFSNCCGVSYRCFELRKIFGWSKQLFAAFCPMALFMRAYRGMHQENERHRQEMAEEGMSGVDYDDPRKESFHFRPSILKVPFLKKLTKGTAGAEEALKPTAPVRPAPPPQTYPVKDLFNMSKNLERENNPQ